MGLVLTLKYTDGAPKFLKIWDQSFLRSYGLSVFGLRTEPLGFCCLRDRLSPGAVRFA